MAAPLVIAFITTDLRDDLRQYSDPLPSFGAAPTALLEGFKDLPGCEIHIISCVQQPVASPAKIAGNLHYHSIHVGKWGWMRGLYAGCVLAVRKKLREIRPDVVHGQGTERYCALAAAFSGYPNVVTIHGNMSSVGRALGAGPGSFYWLATHLENLALKRTRGVFCNSAYTEGLVSPRARKTWRVPNPLREPFFAPLPAPAHHARPVLVNVGHVSSYKRQIEILDTAARLRDAGADFEFQFIGGCLDTPGYRRDFLTKVAIAEKAGFARYLGVLEPGALAAALDGADAMVHFPSEEAFGLAAAEGLARNLKFFGSRAGGVIDIATGVEGAELIGANDWDALQAAILRWLKSGAPRPGAAAMEMKARYHPAAIAQRHMEIYREVIAP